MSLSLYGQNSGFSRRTRIASFIAVSSLLVCGVAYSDEEVCAHKVLESGMHQGQYNFHFKSWSWRKKSEEYSGDSSGAYLYCNCVKNDSKTNSLFVSWEGVGLKMFIAPGDFGSVVSSFSDSKEGHTQSTLWYGPKPEKIPVDTVVNLASTVPAASPSISVAASNVPQAAAEKKQPLKTFVSAAYPDLQRISSLTGKSVDSLSENDIIAQAEKNPAVLVKFSMTFESTVIYDGDTGKPAAITYHCEYSIPSLFSHAMPPISGLPPALYMKFNNDGVQQAVFHTQQPFALRASWGFHATPDYKGVVKVGTSQLAQENTNMEFLDSSGTHVLVSMPVAFYSQSTESTRVSVR